MQNDCSYKGNCSQKHQHRGLGLGDLGSTRHFGQLKCFHLVAGETRSPSAPCESGFRKQTQLFDAVVMVVENTVSGFASRSHRWGHMTVMAKHTIFMVYKSIQGAAGCGWLGYCLGSNAWNNRVRVGSAEKLFQNHWKHELCMQWKVAHLLSIDSTSLLY